MCLYTKYFWLLLFTCFVCQAFAQKNNTDNVVFVENKNGNINIYKSKGFTEPVKKSFIDSNFINDLIKVQETLEIGDLDEEQANLAYSHAKLKLDKAIFFFDQADIERYNDFIEKIKARLKELFGTI